MRMNHAMSCRYCFPPVSRSSIYGPTKNSRLTLYVPYRFRARSCGPECGIRLEKLEVGVFDRAIARSQLHCYVA